MYDRSQPPNIFTYNSLLDGLCKNHNLERAIALFKKVKEKEILSDVYSDTLIVIDELCTGGRLKYAQEIFQYLLVKGYHIDVWTYIVMINGLCKEGLFDEALALLSKMEHAGCIPNVVAYEIIIRALLQKDDNDSAEELLREMIARGLL